jgi:hypothetical protein
MRWNSAILTSSLMSCEVRNGEEVHERRDRMRKGRRGKEMLRLGGEERGN